MKALILYRSTHHGNTRKLVDHLVKTYGFQSLDVGERDVSLEGYDNIVIASGVYGFELDPDILTIAKTEDFAGKKVFLLYTSASDGKKYAKNIQKILTERKAEIVGLFHCPGYCTFGPFKLFGGIRKNRPNEKDIENLDASLKKAFPEL